MFKSTGRTCRSLFGESSSTDASASLSFHFLVFPLVGPFKGSRANMVAFMWRLLGRSSRPIHLINVDGTSQSLGHTREEPGEQSQLRSHAFKLTLSLYKDKQVRHTYIKSIEQVLHSHIWIMSYINVSIQHGPQPIPEASFVGNQRCFSPF